MLFFNTAPSESESVVHTKAKNPSSSLQVMISHGVDTQPSPERGIVIHCMLSYLVPSEVQSAAVEQVMINHAKLLLHIPHIHSNLHVTEPPYQ